MQPDKLRHQASQYRQLCRRYPQSDDFIDRGTDARKFPLVRRGPCLYGRPRRGAARDHLGGQMALDGAYRIDGMREREPLETVRSLDRARALDDGAERKEFVDGEI